MQSSTLPSPAKRGGKQELEDKEAWEVVQLNY
jgi:hypothetical protein